MSHYSALSILRHGLTGNRHWTRAWRDPAPKPNYDVVNVGGGGHGLATAYYLAKEHGIRNVAVLEKGWLGGGNMRAFPPRFSSAAPGAMCWSLMRAGVAIALPAIRMVS